MARIQMASGNSNESRWKINHQKLLNCRICNILNKNKQILMFRNNFRILITAFDTWWGQINLYTFKTTHSTNIHHIANNLKGGTITVIVNGRSTHSMFSNGTPNFDKTIFLFSEHFVKFYIRPLWFSNRLNNKF